MRGRRGRGKGAQGSIRRGGGGVCPARAQRMPGALPLYQVSYSSPKFILTQGSPPSRPH